MKRKKHHVDFVNCNYLGTLLLLIFVKFGLVFCDYSSMYYDDADQEPSDVYLKNVVGELQKINENFRKATDLSGSAINGVETQNHQHQLYHYDDNSVSNVNQERGPPLADLDTQSSHQVYSPAAIPSVSSRRPMLLGYTPSELAAMYKKALSHGTQVQYDTLVKSINEESPKIVAATKLQPMLNYRRPDNQYAYYFYPFQTFGHELYRNNYGYKTLPENVYDLHGYATTSSETTTGITKNPIVIFISSVVGMTILFVLGLFLYPRLAAFPFARSWKFNYQDELMHLTAFITEAIHNYGQNAWKRMRRNQHHHHSTFRSKKHLKYQRRTKR